MASRVFTDAWIKSLRPTGDRQQYCDRALRGFLVRVQTSGTVTFTLRYSFAGSTKQKFHTLGTYPRMGLAEAREAYKIAYANIKKGKPPSARVGPNVVTVRHIIAAWLFRTARHKRKCPRVVLPELLRPNLEDWFNRPAADITKSEAIAMLGKIVGREAPVMANRVYHVSKQIFKWALTNELYSGINPFANFDAPGAQDAPKTRALSETELRIVWGKLDENLARKAALALKLILVTGQRPGEVRNARCEHFDLPNRVWTIPAENIKTSGVTKRQAKTTRGQRRAAREANERTHYVPLTDLAVEIVQEMLKLAGNHPYIVFNDHIHEKWDQPAEKCYLSHAIRRLQEGTKTEPTIFGLKPFTPHDLRRTVSTRLHAIDVSELWINKLLNHSDKRSTDSENSDRAMSAVYDAHHYWEQKVKALRRLESLYRDILAGKYTSHAEDAIPFPYADNVIPFRQAA